ncbi:MAG: bifunctional aldolase/short-chain dehydrogenase [Magnetococcales bacterium]|nr:bifunctional aldolase/short-chain dehydrogenase [Magnetococcales bacterium]
MKNGWSDTDAAHFVTQYAPQWGTDLALRTYSSRLLGAEKELVLHGGGNTSVKTTWVNILGEKQPALFVKSSGWNLATITPEGHAPLALPFLQRLQSLPELNDADMVRVVRANRLDPDAATPSIEALLHAFLPAKFIDHTHADAILTLSNQVGGAQLLAEALGEEVIILPYIHPGFALAKAVAQAFAQAPASRGMVLMHHGLLTWGETAEAAYAATVSLVNRAEAFIAQRLVGSPPSVARVTVAEAMERYAAIAPLLRGALAVRTTDPDHPWQRFILRPLITPDVLALLDRADSRALLCTPPLTTDHLIRIKPLPLWLEEGATTAAQIHAAVEGYRQDYLAYLEQASGGGEPPAAGWFDASPRLLLMPGVGVVCVGHTAAEAEMARDLAVQTLAVKGTMARMGGRYAGVTTQEQFAMEYYGPQRAKLGAGVPLPLGDCIALVTGAAGAIGSGICRELLRQGCHLAVSDLPGAGLDALVAELRATYGERVVPVAMDVTAAQSVAAGLRQVVQTWGGLDLLVLNAGLAHVSSLEEMQVEAFQRLHRVNVEGTLHLLSALARHFRVQATGGDVVLISTKNVFAPGAQFGAYSATKAAAHQLARIAALELAPLGVRVNMVAPDGVFSEGARPSGLWAAVGPDRMKARGLDAAGLEAYYQNRNLLKARITATHVARAVVFFATRQTPSTGVTLPVDGGLPEATPR